MARWTSADIPDQTGRTAVVTGANTGIGFETARILARTGASMVLACRDPEKGEAAARTIRAEMPAGSARFAPLDLADLDSVAAFAGAFEADDGRLDLLVNNAGVMVPPLGRTKQGFELQLGTNHLGHFALTGRLLPMLERTPGARVVVVASRAQSSGRIDFDDLNWAPALPHARRTPRWRSGSGSRARSSPRSPSRSRHPVTRRREEDAGRRPCRFPRYR
ncbi:MAG: SDR family NAD(P)-dependent oxidoreductase [Actinophytocola sp.]|uniref:SDR family NAD(P)-dependent oxidoreductase n=1 Tax=Actinophytocola sp. TaxID=1872138 RepID=UPI0013213048|nr:SDR family NAD(P)-dependent oxidoreductase [Actinophytocola sp.]MPZ82558.1 SDR family NAD(P)-dependent oxidoreductase [Actinophytocola sp.]